MALSVHDLARLEVKLRVHADVLRFRAQAEATSPAMKALAQAEIEDARDFDVTADLIVGLQGSWEETGPIVRRGYQQAMAEQQRVADAAARGPAEKEAA